MTEICSVPECPAFATDRSVGTCRAHRDALLAKQLNCAGRNCVNCGRAIRKDDWCWREMQAKAGTRKPGDAYGWAHVHCDPPPRQSKQALRESEKPLLSDL